jgi:uncharacterized protein
MTRIVEVDMPCPNCGRTVGVGRLMSFTTIGRDSDLRPVMAGMSPWGAELARCDGCGFVGSDADFEGRVSAEVSALIREHIGPGADEGAGWSPRNWEHAAQIARWRGEPDRELGMRYLRAAWAMRERQDDRETHFQRLAVTHLSRCLDADQEAGTGGTGTGGTAGTDASELAHAAYLVGELNRRLGDADQAALWFDRAVTLCAADPELGALAELATRQKTQPSDTL